MMYRLRWYCCAIQNGGRFGDLRTIYQGCRALPFALAGLSCMTWYEHADLCFCNVDIVLGSFCIGLDAVDGCCLGLGLGA